MKILTGILLGLLAVLQYDLWIGEGSLRSAWHLGNTISEQKQENARLTTRNETLAAEVNDLKSGRAAIEERARSELGMIKNNETFIQIVDKPGQTTSP